MHFIWCVWLTQFTLFKRLAAGAALAVAAGLAPAADLTVSAASSLSQAFKEIAQSFEARHPEVKIALNFGASGALLQQLAKGAPVDVLASADQETMDLAEKQGLVVAGERRDFVGNRLVLIVPGDSRLSIGHLQDLAQPGVRRIAIGNPASVPAGRYARGALQAARLWPVLQARVISTQNVRQALDYVARGEVDAGFVYATDASLMKEQVRVVAQVSLDRPIRYPVAKTAGSLHSEQAQRFIDFLALPGAQAVFARHGFLKP